LVLGQTRSIRKQVITELYRKGVPHKRHATLGPDLFNIGLVAALESFRDEAGNPLPLGAEVEPGKFEAVDGQAVDYGDELEGVREHILNASGNAIARELYGDNQRRKKVKDEILLCPLNTDEVNTPRFTLQKYNLDKEAEFNAVMEVPKVDIGGCRLEFLRKLIRDALIKGDAVEIVRRRVLEHSFAQIEEETGIGQYQARRVVDRVLREICQQLGLPDKPCRRGKRKAKPAS
jgi:hypothetical protein